MTTKLKTANDNILDLLYTHLAQFPEEEQVDKAFTLLANICGNIIIRSANDGYEKAAAIHFFEGLIEWIEKYQKDYNITNIELNND